MFKRYSLIKTLTKNFNILSNADADTNADANADADVTAIALPVLSYRRAKNGSVCAIHLQSTAKVMSGWSVILATLFLGKPPTGRLPVYSAYSFHHYLTNALPESAEEDEWP